MQSGGVIAVSVFEGVVDEDETQGEDIENNLVYLPIERIPSQEAYQWMEDFVIYMVARENEQSAEKLAGALRGTAHSGDSKIYYHVLEMSGCKYGYLSGLFNFPQQEVLK